MSKSIKSLDGQGRVILPSHIRKALHLDSGSLLEIESNDDGTIRITPATERCAICENPLDKESAPLEVKVGAKGRTKRVCRWCCAAAATAARIAEEEE